MGYQLPKDKADMIFHRLASEYDIWAPRCMKGEGTFSDIDVIRYGKVDSLDEIEWEKKSDYSFKEFLIPINETLFYFTEDQTTVPKEEPRDMLVFLRACDLNAVKRLDQIYLDNVFGDYYYDRRRKKVKFVLMGCQTTCASGFCVSMGTNRADNYDACLKLDGNYAYADVKDQDLLEKMCELIKDQAAADGAAEKQADVTPDFVTENIENVILPKNLSNDSFSKEIWKEYGGRCITCGRCNFACPTCTCFTMQDIFYQDNPKVGERRRIWASCHVDGYTDMAGGHGFRKDKADRMRFKVMHKIYDFQKRFGYTMCVGCGRCDDICPEYISYSNLVNRLANEESACES